MAKRAPFAANAHGGNMVPLTMVVNRLHVGDVSPTATHVQILDFELLQVQTTIILEKNTTKVGVPVLSHPVFTKRTGPSLSQRME